MGENHQGIGASQLISKWLLDKGMFSRWRVGPEETRKGRVKEPPGGPVEVKRGANNGEAEKGFKSNFPTSYSHGFCG